MSFAFILGFFILNIIISFAIFHYSYDSIISRAFDKEILNLKEQISDLHKKEILSDCEFSEQLNKITLERHRIASEFQNNDPSLFRIKKNTESQHQQLSPLTLEILANARRHI